MSYKTIDFSPSLDLFGVSDKWPKWSLAGRDWLASLFQISLWLLNQHHGKQNAHGWFLKRQKYLWCWGQEMGLNNLSGRKKNKWHVWDYKSHSQGPFSFIHWDRDEMAAILLPFYYLYENCWILIQISLKFVPKGPVSNKSALLRIFFVATNRCFGHFSSMASDNLAAMTLANQKSSKNIAPISERL